MVASTAGLTSITHRRREHHNDVIAALDLDAGDKLGVTQILLCSF